MMSVKSGPVPLSWGSPVGKRNLRWKGFTVVKFRVNYGGGNGAGCFEVKVGLRADTAKFTNVIVARLRKCSDLIGEGKVFVENKTKVASRVGCSERAVLYFRELLSSIRKNSVLEELRVRRLAVIQDEICCRAFCKWLMLEWKSDGWKERKSCVPSAYRWWFKERDETRVLSGVVYMTKSRGPRTELWGTPQRQVCREEKSLLHLTRKQRDER